MRVPDPMYRHSPVLPGWVASLRAQLSQGGEDSPPERLLPVAALTETLSVASAAASGDGSPSRENRRSLVQDLRCFVFGGYRIRGAPCPQQPVSSARSDEHPEASRLTRNVTSPSGRRARSTRTGERSEVIEAAWDDTLSAFADEGCEAERCELRIAQLNELASERGWIWSELSRVIEE